MTLCSIYSSVQRGESRMNMLIYHRPCTTSVITAANLPSVFSETNRRSLFSSPWFFFPFFLLHKNDNARHRGCLSPAWTVICALCLQGDNGGMTTMSNMTHRVSREEDGMELTCEAFNKGTHFSKTQTAKLSVFCEWARVWCSWAAVFLVSKKKKIKTLISK